MTSHCNPLLYIIGNGFDLHNRIPSSYTNFGHYVLSVDSNLHTMFEDYFSFDGNWADFENTLAHLAQSVFLMKPATILLPIQQKTGVMPIIMTISMK
jgi:hypothetical protein